MKMLPGTEGDPLPFGFWLSIEVPLGHLFNACPMVANWFFKIILWRQLFVADQPVWPEVHNLYREIILPLYYGAGDIYPVGPGPKRAQVFPVEMNLSYNRYPAKVKKQPLSLRRMFRG